MQLFVWKSCLSIRGTLTYRHELGGCNCEMRDMQKDWSYCTVLRIFSLFSQHYKQWLYRLLTHSVVVDTRSSISILPYSTYAYNYNVVHYVVQACEVFRSPNSDGWMFVSEYFPTWPFSSFYVLHSGQRETTHGEGLNVCTASEDWKQLLLPTNALHLPASPVAVFKCTVAASTKFGCAEIFINHVKLDETMWPVCQKHCTCCTLICAGLYSTQRTSGRGDNQKTPLWSLLVARDGYSGSWCCPFLPQLSSHILLLFNRCPCQMDHGRMWQWI